MMNEKGFRMKTEQTRQSSQRYPGSLKRFSIKLALFASIAILGLIALNQWQGAAAAAGKIANNAGDIFGSAVFITNVPPSATFLHTIVSDNPDSSDSPDYPVIIDLSQAGYHSGEEIKLTYQVHEPFTFNRYETPVKHAEPVLLAVFSLSGVLLPPQELKRVPGAVKMGDDFRTGPAGPIESSEPDDINEDFQILPASGTIVRVPEGATHLFLGVADSFYKDNEGQISVSVERVGFYDICLQDDTSGDLLLFNSNTGDFKFIRCGTDGFVIEKPGLKHTISRKRCQVSLNDSTVSAVLDTCDRRGSATIRTPGYGAVFVIRDSNTKDNTCACK
jgi:hypothetical protein